MEVFFRFGFGHLSGSQAVEETNGMPALACFQTESLWDAAKACRFYQAMGKI